MALVLCEGADGLRDSLVVQRVRHRIQLGASGSIAWMQLWCRAGLWHECWTVGTDTATDRQGRTFSFETQYAKAASAHVCLLYAQLCLGLWAPWTSVLFSLGMCLTQLIPSPTLTVPDTKWGRVPRAPWTVLPQKGDCFAKQRPSGEAGEGWEQVSPKGLHTGIQGRVGAVLGLCSDTLPTFERDEHCAWGLLGQLQRVPC